MLLQLGGHKGEDGKQYGFFPFSIDAIIHAREFIATCDSALIYPSATPQNLIPVECLKDAPAEFQKKIDTILGNPKSFAASVQLLKQAQKKIKSARSVAIQKASALFISDALRNLHISARSGAVVLVIIDHNLLPHKPTYNILSKWIHPEFTFKSQKRQTQPDIRPAGLVKWRQGGLETFLATFTATCSWPLVMSIGSPADKFASRSLYMLTAHQAGAPIPPFKLHDVITVRSIVENRLGESLALSFSYKNNGCILLMPPPSDTTPAQKILVQCKQYGGYTNTVTKKTALRRIIETVTGEPVETHQRHNDTKKMGAENDDVAQDNHPIVDSELRNDIKVIKQTVDKLAKDRERTLAKRRKAGRAAPHPTKSPDSWERSVVFKAIQNRINKGAKQLQAVEETIESYNKPEFRIGLTTETLATYYRKWLKKTRERIGPD